MIKKENIIKISIITLVILLLTSCFGGHSFVQDVTKEREQGYEIIRCLDDRDSESLLKLFSDTVKEKYDLDEQIIQLFDAYDGKSIWYDKLFNVGYGDSIDNGVLAKRKATYWIDITTQLGFKPQYTVVVGTYSIFQDDPSMLGILYITLTDLSTDEMTVIGEFKS
ncbi:MAG: DUF5104 domain-containing protein [Ruminiclostridium sp.]